MNFFLKNVGIFLLGAALQVVAALFPDYAALGPIGGLFLSAAQMGAALNGSFAKHLTVALIALSLQVVSIALKNPAVSLALLPLSAALFQMSNLAKILAGIGLPGAGAAVAGAPVTVDPTGHITTAPPPADPDKTPPVTKR